MAPPRFKKNHRSGGGKHVSSFEEVQARNNAKDEDGETAAGSSRPSSKQQARQESSDEASSDEGPQRVSKKGVNSVLGLQTDNPNGKKVDEMKEGIELTRKQREEIEKANARRRYEELHKAGKTDEAKADLARLEEVKKRREDAAKKREEELASAKEKETQKGKEKSGMSAEQKAALGGEAARLRGERSQQKKKEEDTKREPRKPGPDLFTFVKGVDDGAEAKAAEDVPDPKKKDGSIQSCRAVEDDFM
mmetsp:Transcript_57727/g.160940  ORF Transcript_57727/g.160940 Transcript_57727/m.160940 type:complete len:249 (+) Transcript_57727:85-831(+)|eukprot:CAMPEP_0117524730 /NCGR_PEP_ID=MMETSP0784-20121206/35400_1 /TAXON_ID=39447 /ORGANISM="" /LENGTH=248 /DNA_ID=CAMNT_0005320895 /DNA_START=85 /DNA_END=831 /DNA_ORIENTATION=+